MKMTQNSKKYDFLEILPLLLALAFLIYLFIVPIDMITKVFSGGIVLWISLQNHIRKAKKKTVRFINYILLILLLMIGLVGVLQKISTI